MLPSLLRSGFKAPCRRSCKLDQSFLVIDNPLSRRPFSLVRKSRSRNMMDKLEDLPSVSRISDSVVRVLGQNPGKFTLQGTNTYIIGTQAPYILIDTAEGKPEYPETLSSALDTLSPPANTLADVSDIVLSHWHFDHIGGLPSVLALLLSRWKARNPASSSASYPAPRLHKYPIPPNDAGAAATTHNHLDEVVKALPEGSFTPTTTGSPFHDLHDRQLFRSSSPTIRVIHAPGHTVDSIALEIPDDRALYTADTVLGQGTAVFEDLRTYLQTLNNLLNLGKDDPTGYHTLYPAHGPVVKNGRDLISTYIKHRLEREQQILDVLHQKPSEGQNWTTWTIVKVIYSAYPEDLWLPAARGIHLHLKKLEGDRIVKCLGGEGVERSWKLVSRTPSPSL